MEKETLAQLILEAFKRSESNWRFSEWFANLSDKEFEGILKWNIPHPPNWEPTGER